MDADPFADTKPPTMMPMKFIRPEWKKYVACYCSAYPWIHTVGIGKCDCSYKRVYKHTPFRVIHIYDCGEDLCEACGQPAETEEIDYGVGSYEFWGQLGTHTDWQEVTICCEAMLVPNKLESRQPGWFEE